MFDGKNGRVRYVSLVAKKIINLKKAHHTNQKHTLVANDN